jgi:hypothetical protein
MTAELGWVVASRKPEYDWNLPAGHQCHPYKRGLDHLSMTVRF